MLTFDLKTVYGHCVVSFKVKSIENEGNFIINLELLLDSGDKNILLLCVILGSIN